MPPPGLAPAPTRRSQVGGQRGTAIGAALVSQYVAKAMNDPDCAHLSANRISRLVRRFVAEGRSEPDLVRFVLAYSDPTAATAIRNVLREGKGVAR